MNAQHATSAPNKDDGKLPAFIPMIVEGSTDTLLSAARGNQLVRTANAINSFRGEGAVFVFHGASQIRLSIV